MTILDVSGLPVLPLHLPDNEIKNVRANDEMFLQLILGTLSKMPENEERTNNAKSSPAQASIQWLSLNSSL